MNYSAQLNPKQLYNGNIVTWTSAVGKPKTASNTFKTHLLSTFSYDQLNRITSSQHYDYANTTKGNEEFSSAYSYDANGNMRNLQRTANGKNLDNLTYDYHETKKNQLLQVADAIGATPETGDFEGVSQYTYDKIGNLISDSKEGISNIEWTLTGKVKRVVFNNGKPTLEFVYDPMGNRVAKISKENSDPRDWKYTYYSKDATGNTMAVYDRKTEIFDTQNIHTVNNNTAIFRPLEYPIYGSSRLGNYIPQADNMTKVDYTLQSDGNLLYSTPLVVVKNTNDYLNSRNYELNDHLGNVSATVSDYKINTQSQQLSAHVYYPFGMELPSSERCVGKYRYGFNGQEKEDEINSSVTSAEYWMYDGRLGRRWNQDPKPNPSISNYACFANNPVLFSDHMGDTIHRFRPDGTYMDAFDDGKETNTGLMYTSTSTSEKEGKKYNRYSDPVNFDFNDYDLDRSELEFTKINIVKDSDLKEDLKTVHGQKGNENLLLFMERESRPDGHESWFSGISKGQMDPRTSFGSVKDVPGLFLIQNTNGKNVVYNKDDFGNFLWGMAGSSFGLPEFVLKTAAHVNNATSGDDQNMSDVPLLDSEADQRAIEGGITKNKQFENGK